MSCCSRNGPGHVTSDVSRVLSNDTFAYVVVHNIII